MSTNSGHSHSHRHWSNGSTLWMGDIDDNMNESFIKTSFHLVNYNPVHVKLVRNRANGQPIGYGFVSFDDEETAQRVLRELNGKQIPNAIQGKRFRLNNTSTKEEEFSIYVGDLSPDVDDNQLFSGFARHFSSVLSAKVMVSDGQSRRFGFVRFGQESEYRKALTDCDNSLIVGSQPVSVRAAKPRRQHNQKYNYSKNRMFEAIEAIPQDVFVPQAIPQPPNQEVAEQPAYNLDVNPYYGNIAISNQPVLVYPMLPFGAFPVNYDSVNYVYGQPAYGQQFYYQTSDNNLYPFVGQQLLMEQMAHNQLVDKQMDKLGEDVIPKSEDIYSSIECNRWSSQLESDKEAKVQ